MFRTNFNDTVHLLHTSQVNGRPYLSVLKHQPTEAVEYPSLLDFFRALFPTVEKPVADAMEAMITINYAALHIAKQSGRAMGNEVLVSPTTSWDLSRLLPEMNIGMLDGLADDELVIYYAGKNSIDHGFLWTQTPGVEGIKVIAMSNVAAYGVIVRKV